MNYRHAYHAGNHADCLKHALLAALLGALARKPAPFLVLDTHAGIGRYDLEGPQAAATGEWRGGIGRLWANPHPDLAAYLALAPPGPAYPGSPALIRALLRPQDRLICCELHPQDWAILRRHFAADPQVAVHHRDGYEALRGLLPAVERRGLVLIDPPYEDENEVPRLLNGLALARARFATAIVVAWVPIKHLAPIHALRHAIASGFRHALACMLWLHAPLDPTRLAGSLLLVLNPPYGFEPEAAAILAALRDRLGGAEAGYRVERWAEE